MLFNNLSLSQEYLNSNTVSPYSMNLKNNCGSSLTGDSTLFMSKTDVGMERRNGIHGQRMSFKSSINLS